MMHATDTHKEEGLKKKKMPWSLPSPPPPRQEHVKWFFFIMDICIFHL